MKQHAGTPKIRLVGASTNPTTSTGGFVVAPSDEALFRRCKEMYREWHRAHGAYRRLGGTYYRVP